MIVTAVVVREIKRPRYAKDLGESQVIAGGAEGTRTPDPHTARGGLTNERDLATI
jgi:hypothetical protein